MKVIQANGAPIKIWSELETVETAAIEQLYNVSHLPFIFKHIAAMPDVHLGTGATVGSVIATKDAIIPAAVGVDIGCGMMAVKTNLNPWKVQEDIKTIRHQIERSIPTGFNSNKVITPEVEAWAGWSAACDNPRISLNLLGKAKAQLGTLGGGNHFIELCLDTEGFIWIMLHSGSRNIGKVLADFHIKRAKKLMSQYFLELPDPDLAFLPEFTPEFKEYLADVTWCQEYAAANRQEMMRRILADLTRMYGPIETLCAVNCHHNYIAREHHFGETVFVTRKGAVRAREGELGIIPGSMGTRSYITVGKGNPDSYCSSSHGAGRTMSRSAAKKKFTLEDLAKQTEGVECRKDADVIDEIPGAYKDIDLVMENQKDLVSIKATLKALMCIKG